MLPLGNQWQQFNSNCCIAISLMLERSFTVDSLFRFLQKACSSAKEMQAISMEEIEQASRHLPLLTKINDKGLLVLMLAKIIAEKYAAFPRILTLLHAEMFPVERAPRVRRVQDDDDGERRRRQRKRRANPKDVDLSELSNESLINPVQVLPPAVGEIRTRLDNPDQNSKGSNPSSKDGQAEQPMDANFPQVLSQLQRQLGVEQEMNPDQGDNSQTNSSTDSSRFGAITNFSKKLDILGQSVIVDRTVRRPRPPPASGRRTRRKGESVLDIKIDLDQTDTSIRNQSLDVTIDAIRTRHHHLDDYAHQHRFNKAIADFTERIRHNIFSEDNRPRLLRFAKRGRVEERAEEREGPQEAQDLTDYTDPLTSYFPQSTLFEQPDSIYRDHLDSNIFQGAEKVTLSELQKRVNKPRWEVFQNLLWLSQQGEITLEQAKPETFGEITVVREERAS